MAALEAASIAAFNRLARELEAHGAPTELVARAREAMHDEVRHARRLLRLAREHGALPTRWRKAKLPLRAPFEVAMENAVEGCVREAFGAAVALVQARRASSGEIRSAFAVIGEEECRHAALAWDVHDWYLRHLTAPERASIERAQRHAAATIEHDFGDATTRRALGLPDPALSRALLEAMNDQLGVAA
jgi:rubrerythrin